MYENKFTTVVMCVCVSFQFFFTLTKAHKEPTERTSKVSDFRLNRRLLRRITNVLREERYLLPKSHQELAARANTLAMQTQRPHLSKYMLDLYESAKEIEDLVSEMDVPWKRNGLQKGNIRPLIKGILPRRQYHVKFIWEYSFNRSNLPDKVYDSELVLTLQHHRHRHCHFTDLRLHTTPSQLSLPKMHFKENNLVMNVTDIVKNAQKLKTEDFTLRIISPRLHRQPCLSNTSILLVMYTGVSIESIRKATIHRKHQLSRTLVGRHRRSADNSSSLQEMPFQRENHTVNNLTVCHMKPWEVHFSDIQWNWIQYPSNYSASYCTGLCIGLMDSRISNHAFLRNKYHMATRYTNRHIPFSCCVPSLLSPLTILYTDTNQNLLVGQLQNMVVQNCSCW